MDFHAQSFQTQALCSSLFVLQILIIPTVIACEVEQKMKPSEGWMAGLWFFSWLSCCVLEEHTCASKSLPNRYLHRIISLQAELSESLVSCISAQHELFTDNFFLEVFKMMSCLYILFMQ